jgi:AcrR family transcriptional regulator
VTKPGLRERKKQKTRGAIQREAMRLFQEQGYDATTVEQIAEAAEVSQSTFFRYFPTKEDVVLLDDYDPTIERLIAERPADEPPATAVRGAILEALRIAFAEDEQLIRDRIGWMFSVPAIRARMFEQANTTTELVCDVLAKRTGRDRESFEIKVAAGTITGALNTAMTHWATRPGLDLADLVTRALDLVDSGLSL